MSVSTSIPQTQSNLHHFRTQALMGGVIQTCQELCGSRRQRQSAYYPTPLRTLSILSSEVYTSLFLVLVLALTPSYHQG